MYLYTNVNRSIIHNSQKVQTTQYPLVHAQRSKMWCVCMCYTHKMEYCSALKNEILSHAITRMNLENAMLSEIRQSQKDKYCKISILIHRDRKSNGSCQGQREGGMGSCLMGSVSVWNDEKFQEMGGSDCCTAMLIYLMALDCTFKND